MKLAVAVAVLVHTQIDFAFSVVNEAQFLVVYVLAATWGCFPFSKMPKVVMADICDWD